jgi:polyphosphate kinase
LRYEFLEAYLRDNVKARELNGDGTYKRVPRAPGEDGSNSQTSFQYTSNIIPFEAKKG